ncbi:MAG TPA: cyclic nucleotide-binding domain-containing protein [Rectinemataceae bacterium]|nr:cyclic nucleotide-binding domain-containing protein [Rectinemataceae bacterium]
MVLPLISWDSRGRAVWNALVLVAIMGFAFIITYGEVFRGFQFSALYYLLNLIFLVDLLLNFRTTIKRGHIRIEEPRGISQTYLHGWFSVDFIAAFPFELIPVLVFGSIPADHTHFPLFLSLQALTLVKLLKAVRLLRDLFEVLGFTPAVRRLVTFGFWFAIGVHFMALGWIVVGAAESFRPHQDQYLRALYWVTTTIATIGYGDYTPDHNKNTQIIYAIVVQIFGVGMYTYLIANVASLVQNIDVARAAYQRRIEEVNAFLRAQEIPQPLQERVRDYYSYLWSQKRSVEPGSVVDELPKSLALDILLFLNRDLLAKVELFQGADELFIRESVQLLRPRVFLPDEYIIRQGEYGDCMYFITGGEVEISVDGSRITVLGAGSPVGETALVENERRNASVRCLTYSTGYQLSRSDFDALRAKYPEFDARVREIVERRKIEP